jgi:hypothetical protein
LGGKDVFLGIGGNVLALGAGGAFLIIMSKDKQIFNFLIYG